MNLKTTHTNTHVLLELSPAAYAEIKQKLEAAGYRHAFDHDDGRPIILMTDIAVAAEAKPSGTTEEKYQQACKTPSDIYQHLPTLRRYAEQCSHVTEMGVRTIVSTWAFLAAYPMPRVVSIDYIHPREAGGDLDEVFRLAAQENRRFDFVQADTRKIDIGETDLLFIDTWHVYEQLKAELERHAGKVRKFIILHDTTTFGEKGETEGHRGLKPAVDEFLWANKEWFVREEFTNCNGLMILERGA